MLKNYLKLSIRSVLKNRFYALFNVVGLSIGITGSFLIFLYLQHELSYDKGFSKSRDIYRLGIEYNISGKIDKFCNVPRPVGPKFKDEFPEVVEYTRMAGVNGLYTHEAQLEFNQSKVKTNQIFYADSSFFKIFDYSFLKGDPNSSLAQPNSIVINETLSKRLFGNADPMNQLVRLDDGTLVKVKGLLRDFQGNTHMPFEALISWSTIHDEQDNSRWLGKHVYTYILIHDKAKPASLFDKYPAFYEKYMAETFKQLNATNSLILQPLTDIHLTSDLNWEAYVNGNIINIYIFSIVIAILLTLACINYINLETARLVRRSREVGIRKIIGAKKSSLIIHGLLESIIISLFAVVLSAVISQLILPWFNQLSNLNLTLDYFSNPEYLLGLVFLGILLGLVSGLLPAIYASNFKVTDSLTVKSGSGGKTPLLRKILVVCQLTFSIALVVCAMTVERQVLFMKNKDIGYEKDDIMVIEMTKEILSKHVETIKSKLSSIPKVIQVASAVNIPGDELNQTAVNVTQPNKEFESMASQFMEVDYDFLQFMGMNLKEGRFFDRSFEADPERSVIVNETAVKKFGWSDNPLNQKIDFGLNKDGGLDQMNVIGVINDFHASSLHDEIQPILIFVVDPIPEDSKLFVKLNSQALNQTIAQVEKVLKKFDPGNTLEYDFVDENLASKYIAEEKTFVLIRYFSFLIIAISALGLFGLVSYTSDTRKREISIRKVLGSSVNRILMLLSAELVVLIGIANIIAWPVAYFGMQNWLNGFAYRINVSLTVFIYAGIISMLVTALAVGYHTIRAARANPVDHLRNE